MWNNMTQPGRSQMTMVQAHCMLDY